MCHRQRSWKEDYRCDARSVEEIKRRGREDESGGGRKVAAGRVTGTGAIRAASTGARAQREEEAERETEEGEIKGGRKTFNDETETGQGEGSSYAQCA